jgi:hypothetical protein
MTKRLSLVVATMAACSFFVAPQLSGPCRAADPAPASPFDKDDPEIAQLRALNWKSVDFDALDPRGRCTAYYALNRGLQNLGTKADARLELLIDYIDEQKLGEAYAVEKGLGDDFKPAAFDDLKKVAVAYVKTDIGSTKVGKEFDSTTDELLGRYLTLYEKTARREYEEGCESRLQVRSMALFLERQGKLEAFKQWAVVERAQRQAEFEKERAADQAAAQQAAQERKEQAQITAEAKRQQQQEERAAAQMERAVQQQSSGGYDSDDSWGGNWGYGQNYYY